MSVIASPTVAAASVTVEDRCRAEAFIASNEESVLAILLQQVLIASERGVDVYVFARDAELTPNQAAELLHMSRPHLLAYLDRGDLAFHRVGTHRRIKMADLLEFMRAREAGAEILANALHASPTPQDFGSNLTQSELAELESI